jgi:hypothetical protein
VVSLQSVPPNRSQARTYEIRIRGELGQMLLSAFPSMGVRPDGSDTVLAGMLADSSALYGVIAEIEALGLELLEVRCTTPGLAW